jgi:hypothetical protein
MQEATSWDIGAFVTFSVFVMMSVVFLFLFLAPVIKLLRRTGHSPFWCLFAIFPGANVVAFWIFAFKPWPMDVKSSNAKH